MKRLCLNTQDAYLISTNSRFDLQEHLRVLLETYGTYTEVLHSQPDRENLNSEMEQLLYQIEETRRALTKLTDDMVNIDDKLVADVDMKNASEVFQVLADILMPLLKGLDRNMQPAEFNPKIHQDNMHKLAKLFGTNNVVCKGLYYHYLQCHCARDVAKLKSKFPNFSFASLSTQRGEHCNKLTKGMLKNLFYMWKGHKDRPELTAGIHVIKNQMLKVLHFPDSISKTRHFSDARRNVDSSID